MTIPGAFVVAAVGLAVGESGAAASPGASPDPPDRARPLLTAYHGLHKARLREEGWESLVREYDLILAFPPMRAEQLAAIRAVHPDVILLAYTNCRSLPYQVYPGDYWAELDARLPAAMRIRDLEDGEPVFNAYRASYFVMTQAAAESLVAMHRDVTTVRVWDGLFLDDCTPTIPRHVWKDVAKQTNRFDFDGDGEADTVEDARRTYETWRPYFTRRLREELGDTILLIANSGGSIDDPALNGISLEAIGTLWTESEAMDILERQRAVGRRPWLGVGWVEHVADIEPTSRLARELDQMYYGVKRQYPYPVPR